MQTAQPAATFKDLPLTPEQDSEIRHYIRQRERAGLPWNTAELAAMVADMLDPPELADEDGLSVWNSMAKERSSSLDRGDQDTGGTVPERD